VSATLHDPTARLARMAAVGGLALLALALAALVGLWAWDRSRPRETPRFEAARFVALATPSASPDAAPRALARASSSDSVGARERWLMVVNPLCHACRAAFPRVAARASAAAGAPALEVLVVDTSERPGAAALAPFPAARAWWDSAGVWRGRWRHRAYAEVLRFDARGALLGIDPAPREP
jgi:hypothetical protein